MQLFEQKREKAFVRAGMRAYIYQQEIYYTCTRLIKRGVEGERDCVWFDEYSNDALYCDNSMQLNDLHILQNQATTNIT